MRLGGFGGVTQRYLKWFHNAGDGAMVSTDLLKRELVGEGFERVVVTPLGVDVDLFSKNNNSNALPDLARPIFVFLGRVAIEKNIRAFLEARVPGTKVVIGDGPDKEKLEEEFRGKAIFTGYKTGQELIDILSVARVMVFPSRTDTLGLVILEALACSLPVAAFDVGGPKDIITNGLDGYAGNNIEESIKNCLNLRPEDCRAKALGFSWERSVDLFIENLVPLRG
jgi:glycosyltransferase involved in cell wall biosynthesis